MPYRRSCYYCRCCFCCYCCCCCFVVALIRRNPSFLLTLLIGCRSIIARFFISLYNTPIVVYGHVFSFLFQAELINEVCTNYTRDDSCDQDGAEHLDCLTLEDVEAGLKSLRPLKSRYVGRAFLTLISFPSFSHLKDLLLMCFVSHMFVSTPVRLLPPL